MPLLYTEQKFHSEQNGELRYQRYWDRTWLIKVPQGEYYSGNYLENMWRVVPRRFVEDAPKDVLILGCGAYCAVDSVLKLWPESRVDALDYDPTIVEIGKTIYGDFEGKKVNIIIADAKPFVAETKKKYDLVLVDIFYGNRPAPLLKDPQFLSDLRNILKNNSTLITNIATSLGGKDEEMFRSWDASFPESTETRYLGNTLKVFIKKNIPVDYYDVHQGEQYAGSLAKGGMTVLGRPGSYLYINRLPFSIGVITAIHTDNEPDIDIIKKETGLKHGLVIWSPWKNSFANKPWRRLLLPPVHPKGNGLAYIAPNYRERWNQTARRDLKRFERSSTEINPVSREQFVGYLMLSNQKNSIKSMFRGMLDKLKDSNTHCWVAEKAGKVISGLAVMDYENISYHLAAFTSLGEEGTGAGTGLIDHWYKYAIRKGVKYLNFGHIRQVGESRSWQGFSDFKRKFIDEEIVTRNQYFRIF